MSPELCSFKRCLTHVAEAAPHHLELIDQLLVQGTHFWVHQLLVHSQADSEDVNLQENNKHRQIVTGRSSF